MGIWALCLVAQLYLVFGVAGLIWPEKFTSVFGILMFPWPASYRAIRVHGIAAIALYLLFLLFLTRSLAGTI